MTFKPTITNSGPNTVTAQYNIAQTESQPKELTTKDTQILKSLESALPFFDASDYGVKAEKGKADKPPVNNDGGKGGGGVKEFFKNLGKSIMSGFEKIADFFHKHFGKTEAKPTATSTVTTTVIDTGKPEVTKSDGETKPKRYGDPKELPTPSLGSPMPGKAGGQLAFAFVSGGPDGLSSMIGKMSNKLDDDLSKSPNFTGSVKDFVGERLKLSNEHGFGIFGTVGQSIKDQVPDLKLKFADNPTALAILDQVAAFDFDSGLASHFASQIDGLSSTSNPLGAFLRGDNMTSQGLVTLARSEGFNPDTVANAILTPHMDQMADLEKSMSSLEPHMRKKDALTGEHATKMMDLTKTILTDCLKTEGPGSLTEFFGQEHIDRLNTMANEIAKREDLPKDVRNQAIQNFYVDQLFLRTLMPALSTTTKNGTVESTAVQLALSIVNGAKGDKFGEDLRNAFTTVAQDFRQNFVSAMIDLGMPVVQ